MKAFELTSESTANGVVLHLQGEIDACTTSIAEEEIMKFLDKDTKAILLDCSQLLYISASGLCMLSSLSFKCYKRGIIMVLYKLQPKISNIFSIAGLNKMIHVQTSQQEAIELVQRLRSSVRPAC